MGRMKALLMEQEEQLHEDFPRWHIEFEYGYWTAIHENYDAEWLGEEDGWQDNGLRVSARTLDGLREEMQALAEEREDAR